LENSLCKMKYRILYHAEAQKSLLIAPEDCKIRKLKI
jgi:hypothetical protein